VARRHDGVITGQLRLPWAVDAEARNAIDEVHLREIESRAKDRMPTYTRSRGDEGEVRAFWVAVAREARQGPT